MRYKLTSLQLASLSQAKDGVALLELLNEHHKTNITMAFSRASRGRANISLKRFTIPKHALDRGEAYLFYYIIHEFTHCLGYFNHEKAFKMKEREILSIFDITIDYARAYPTTLYANGDRVYSKTV